jgi:hypothetical protein
MRLIYGLLLYWLLFAPALTYYDGGGFFCLHVGVDTRGCFILFSGARSLDAARHLKPIMWCCNNFPFLGPWHLGLLGTLASAMMHWTDGNTHGKCVLWNKHIGSDLFH